MAYLFYLSSKSVKGIRKILDAEKQQRIKDLLESMPLSKS